MGLELAKAFIRVRADASKLPADLKAQQGRTTAMISGMASKISGALAGIGVGIGGAQIFTSLIQSGEEFERKMRNSLAIMGDVSDVMRNDMTQAALEAARTTQFSAAQAAESYFFLASAGLDAQQSIKALPQVAAFAQAGMFDMATATDLATDAQSALGLTVKDADQNLQNLTRVTDTLIGANTLANASAEQFSTALTTKAGTSAAQAGKEIEEVVAVLSVFADKGVKGQLAGTAFAIVMRDLQTQFRKNRAEFDKAGIAVFDSAGKMNNLGDIVGQLEARLSSMTPEMQAAELATLGFNDKSKIFIQTLIGSSEQIKNNESRLRTMAGITQRIADKQLTDMQKAVAELGAAFTELGTGVNDQANPAMRSFVELATNAATATNNLLIKTGALNKGLEGTETRMGKVNTLMESFSNFTGGLKGKEPTGSKSGQLGFLGLPGRFVGAAGDALGQEPMFAMLKQLNRRVDLEKKSAEVRKTLADQQKAAEAEEFDTPRARAEAEKQRLADIEAAVEAEAQAAKASEEFSEKQETVVDALQQAREELIDMKNKTTDAQKAMREFLGLEGTTLPQILEFAALTEEIDRTKAAAKALKKEEEARKKRDREMTKAREASTRRGESITKSLQTKSEKAAAAMHELLELRSTDDIDRTTLLRGLEEQKRILEKDLQPKFGTTGIAGLGSSIQSAIFSQANNPQKITAEESKKQTAILGRLDKHIIELKKDKEGPLT